MQQNNQSGDYFGNQFLVSTPQLDDPNFHQSVILLCKHDNSGAMGIIINRRSGYHAREIFNQLDIEISADTQLEIPIHDGGPVYPELGLILHTDETSRWESSISIGEKLHLTSSRDILCDIAKGTGPDQAFMSLGYAGWGPGQLENEIHQNAWFTTPADHEILFAVEIEHKWHNAASLIGIDTSKFSGQVGHA